MGNWIIYVVIALYAVLMLATGLVTAKKADSIENFTVGGRNAGAWITALSYGATYFSAVVMIGYAGNSGWNFGFWAVLIGLGNALIGSMLAWFILARRTREVTQRLKISSMPQLFEKRYQSKNMKIFSALIIFVFMIPYSASVYTGLGYLCEQVLHIPYEVCTAIIAIAAAISLVLGGYLATLKADFVQGLIMIVGVIILLVYMTFHAPVNGVEGLTEIWNKMKDSGIAYLDGTQTKNLIALILLTSIGTWGLPQMIHKFYGIKDDGEVKRGTIISTFFALLISGGAYYIGSLSRAFMDSPPLTASGAPDFDAVVPTMLIDSTLQLPTLLLGIVLVLILSASVSTLSGLTLTSASSVSMDLIHGTLAPNMSKKNTLLLTRILCFAFIAFSYVVAVFKIDAIINLMSFSWGAIAGSFLAPYLLSLYWKGMNRAGAWAGMAGGLILCIGLNLIDAIPILMDTGIFKLPNAPINGVIAMVGSMVLSVVFSLVARSFQWKSGAKNDAFYQKTADSQ